VALLASVGTVDWEDVSKLIFSPQCQQGNRCCHQSLRIHPCHARLVSSGSAPLACGPRHLSMISDHSLLVLPWS
jgi:hypothetical protein